MNRISIVSSKFKLKMASLKLLFVSVLLFCFCVAVSLTYNGNWPAPSSSSSTTATTESTPSPRNQRSSRSNRVVRIKSEISNMDDNDWFFYRQAHEEFAPECLKGDNITGFPKMIVPNIVHYVVFDNYTLSFSHFVSIKSVLRHQKPDKIIIHCDCNELEGRYWDWLLGEDFGQTTLVIRRVEYREQVFGKPFNETKRRWHASDVARIKALMEFGGIYLDTDIYVVKSLDDFRKFEMTLSYDNSDWKMSNGVQIAHKDARFLKLHLNLYREYRVDKWIFNSLKLPLIKIIKKYPHLVHMLNSNEFGINWTCPLLFADNSSTWRQRFYSFHMFLRGNNIRHHSKWCFNDKNKNGGSVVGPGDKSPVAVDFDENMIKTLNVTFGQMVRLVLYNTTDLIY